MSECWLPRYTNHSLSPAQWECCAALPALFPSAWRWVNHLCCMVPVWAKSKAFQAGCTQSSSEVESVCYRAVQRQMALTLLSFIFLQSREKVFWALPEESLLVPCGAAADLWILFSEIHMCWGLPCVWGSRKLCLATPVSLPACHQLSEQSLGSVTPPLEACSLCPLYAWKDSMQSCESQKQVPGCSHWLCSKLDNLIGTNWISWCLSYCCHMYQ